MELFSNRNGYVSQVLQYEFMDSKLKNGLINVLSSFYFGDEPDPSISMGIDEFIDPSSNQLEVWEGFWYEIRPAAGITVADFLYKYREWYKTAKWNDIYDLIEFALDQAERGGGKGKSELQEKIKKVLKNNHAAYKLEDKKIIPLSNETEIGAVSEAISGTDKYSSGPKHIFRAVEAFAQRPKTSTIETVREAILAVEATVNTILGESSLTLGAALKKLGNQRNYHPALVEGWGKMYGYTSDEEGIRHAGNGDPVEIDKAFAKYMLVSCSAFMNYLIETELEKGTE